MTIDWVALTAGILLLGIMVVYAIFNGGVSSLVSSINDTLRTAALGDGSDSGTSTDRTGNASDQACSKTGKWVVCIGPK